MKDYPFPDELDSLGYAFMEIQNQIIKLVNFKNYLFNSSKLIYWKK